MPHSAPNKSAVSQKISQTISQRLLSGLWLDLRSLALFRIGLGLILLCSLLTIFPDFYLLYTDAGIFTRELLQSSVINPGYLQYWSLHFASNSVVWSYLLYLTTIAVCICFILGLYTRVVSVALYLLILSHVGRNTALIYGYDAIVLVFLFWAMFLPLDRYWAVLPRRSDSIKQDKVYSLATAAFLLQICMVYLSAGFTKSGEEWLSGSAIRTALGNDMTSSWLGILIRDVDILTYASTYATLGIEILAPILLILPTYRLWPRVLGCLLLFSLHMGIAFTMQLGWFPWVCAFVVLTPLPFVVFEKCWAMLAGKLPFGLSVFTRGVFEKVAALFTSLRLGIERYGLVFCKGLSQVFLSLALLSCVLVFFGHLFNVVDRVPSWLRAEVNQFGLSQVWNFFAPNPRALHGTYYIVKGNFRDGSVYDISSGKKEKLQFTEASKINHYGRRLRRYKWQDIIFKASSGYTRRYGSYMCRVFSDEANKGRKALRKITVYQLANYSHADGLRRTTVPQQLWQWRCA